MPLNSVPIYGVEQYLPLDVPLEDDYGGGAEVTQENLLITLWTNPGEEEPTIPGELIKPLGFTPDPGAEISPYQPAYNKQCFRSRLSTRFGYVGGNQEGSTSMLAILNPPGELREALLQNVEPDLANLKLGLKSGLSVWSPLVWEFLPFDSEGEIEGGEVLFSGIPVDDPFALAFPFAKTNGADGVWPEFYFVNSEADLVALLDDLRPGAPFYVAAAIEVQNGAGIVQIRWPFSGAARG